MLVRPYGRAGALQVYDVRSGARRFRLPPGILSADGRTFIAAARVRSRRTTVARYDVRSGRLVRGWSLTGRNWSPAGLAADGSRVALSKNGRKVTFVRVGRSRYVLPGFNEVEALSPNGSRLYLVHWNRTGYDLRQLDLSTRKLSPTRLDEPDEKMTGTAMSSVSTRDGRWLLTLYLKDDGTSFVHALDLRSGLAHCIDLPLAGDFFSVGATALTLSPDERALYLASPFLGRVTAVDLRTLDVARITRFPRLASGELVASLGPSAAVTVNGRMLAFSGGGSLWLYDTAFGKVRRILRDNLGVTGVGFRPGGRSLLALRGPNAPLAFDAATGKRL
jgi:hypothetical protein